MKYRSIIILIIILLSLTAGKAVADGVVTDPSYIGVGARALGMGKAYVAVAEDADAIFMNPAGLAKIGPMKLTSMYANLIGDVRYVVAGGVHPLGIGAIGLGFIGTNAGDIWVLPSNAASSTHHPNPTSVMVKSS